MNQIKEYSLDKIKTHTTKESVWIIIDDYVFDVTTYMSRHPGGSQLFLKYAGTDCTKQFNDTKHADALNYIDDLCIGKVRLDLTDL
jgi:cytochrome b involved in lipid metabolism